MEQNWKQNGKVLACGSLDGTVRLSDAATGEAMRTLESHMSSVQSVAYSPDGQVLAGSSEYGTVRLWDAATGEPLRTLEDHTELVLSVAYRPDGKVLASGSGDRTVRLWDLSSCTYCSTPAYPPTRAALISGALQHLWGLRVDGIDVG